MAAANDSGRVMGITIDGLGEVRGRVPRDRAEEAKALIEEHPPSDIPWDDAE